MPVISVRQWLLSQGALGQKQMLSFRRNQALFQPLKSSLILTDETNPDSNLRLNYYLL